MACAFRKTEGGFPYLLDFENMQVLAHQEDNGGNCTVRYAAIEGPGTGASVTSGYRLPEGRTAGFLQCT